MNKEFKNKEWREFFIGDIAEIVSGRDVYEKERVLGDTPYITSTANLNGIGYFVSNKNETIEADCLSVNRNGSVGFSFYHPYNALFSNDCRKLRLKIKSKYVGLFIATQITKQRTKYGYGYKMGTARLKRQKVMLPINQNKEPDYDFMEKYMKYLEYQKVDIYKKHLENRINNLQSSICIDTLATVKWKEFKLESLFSFEQGKSKGLNHLTEKDYGVSYLGATNNNNGVIAMVEKKRNYIQKGNCIAFIRNGEGSMGYSIYKSEDFIATSDITVGYSEHLNLYVGMFITTIADKIRGKYNFGYKRSHKRLTKEIIQLPVNENGNPDYDYMEQYMRQLEVKILTNYLTNIQ